MSSRRHIAVVDIGDDLAYIIERLFSPNGFNIIRSSSLESWTTEDSPVPVLIFIDERTLPGESLDTLREFKRHHPGIAIMLLVSYLNRRIESHARGAGASQCLLKPVQISTLRTAVMNAIPGIPAPVLTSDSNSDSVATASADKTESHEKSPLSLAPRVAGEAAFDQLFYELEKRQPLPPDMDSFDVVESHLIKRALAYCSGNQSRTARFLGITRNTLRKRIQKYGFAEVDSADSD
jgi:DNA-binding NtrC family response regulator